MTIESPSYSRNCCTIHSANLSMTVICGIREKLVLESQVASSHAHRTHIHFRKEGQLLHKKRDV